jgi:hypothetical protein
VDLRVKLGNDTVGLRGLQPRLDETGQPVSDDFGDQVTDRADVEVRGCLMAPTTRTSGTSEPENRSAPRTAGMTLLAPPRTPIDADTVVIWPITSRQTVDGRLQLDGPLWQVVSDPGPWDESLEVELRRAT